MPTNKKILFICQDSILNDQLAGGQGKNIFKIQNGLYKRGYKVTVITSKYPGFKDGIFEGVFYKHIGVSSRSIPINFITFLLTLPFALILRKDDMAFECFCAPISTLLSPLFFRKKVIGITSMFEADVFSKKYHLPFFIWERFGIRLYKKIISYSDYYKEKVLLMNPRCSVSVIPHGIEDIFLSTETEVLQDSVFGLYIGRIDIFQKGLDLLIESIDHIKRFNLLSSKRHHIVIAGHGSPKEEERLREKINNLGLKDDIIIVGPVSGAEKIQLMSKAAFGIIPSRFETFCMSALEFIALGKSVVHFNINGLKWVPEYCGLKINQFDSVSLAKGVQRAFDLGDKNKNSIRDFAKRFKIENTINQYEEVIRKELNQ